MVSQRPAATHNRSSSHTGKGSSSAAKSRSLDQTFDTKNKSAQPSPSAMSIFSKLRNAKKAADKHKGEKAADEVKPVTPYRHIPTHAAIDALSGAPSSWQLEDRASIRYQNQKRRSEMALSRNYSGLSQATSLNTSINRNSSYNSSASAGSRGSRPRIETRRSQTGYHGHDGFESPEFRSHRASRMIMGKSPLGSTPISPAETSSNASSSSSSSQILEIPGITEQRSTSPAVQELNPNFLQPMAEPAALNPNFLQPVAEPAPLRPNFRRTPSDPTAVSHNFVHFDSDLDSTYPTDIHPQSEPNPMNEVYGNRKRKVGEAPWARAYEKSKVAEATTEIAMEPITPPQANKRRSGWRFSKKAPPIAAH